MNHFQQNNKLENLIQFNLKNSKIKINPLNNLKYNWTNVIRKLSKICVHKIQNKVLNHLLLALKFHKEMLKLIKIK